MAYMLYELSRHPDVQAELRSELASIDGPFSSDPAGAGRLLPQPEVLEGLPLLDACIKESLRLRNTSPNLDARVSPAHGPSAFGRISALPPGTRVGTYGWCLNRNPHVYPNPDAWVPDRWRPGGSPDTVAMNKWLFAFSSGSRGCIGQPIAMECKCRRPMEKVHDLSVSDMVLSASRWPCCHIHKLQHLHRRREQLSRRQPADGGCLLREAPHPLRQVADVMAWRSTLVVCMRV